MSSAFSRPQLSRITRSRPMIKERDRQQWQSLGRHWRLVRLLHQGVSTRVYLASPVLGRVGSEPTHVVKLIPKNREHDQAAIAALAREAHLGEMVVHLALRSTVAAQLHFPPYYVVFPRLAGASLETYLANSGALPIPLALQAARQTAEALVALHAAGWMHGDVKPANLMLSPEGEITLIDLGFARRIDATGLWTLKSPRRPDTESLTGSLGYLAPECLLDAYPNTPQADLYSLGMTLYELLTGTLPFASADSGSELLRQHREARPRPIRELRPAIPPDVAGLTHALLAKNPNRRPHGAAEVVDRLVRLEIDTFSQR